MVCETIIWGGEAKAGGIESRSGAIPDDSSKARLDGGGRRDILKIYDSRLSGSRKESSAKQGK